MKSLKKLAAVFILGAPLGLLAAGCAMGVEDTEGNADDSATLEQSASQAIDDVELQTADIGPGREISVDPDFGRGGRCRDRCRREYRRCQRFDHDFDRDGRDGRRGDRCYRRYERCLSFCFRDHDHGGPDHRGDH